MSILLKTIKVWLKQQVISLKIYLLQLCA